MTQPSIPSDARRAGRASSIAPGAPSAATGADLPGSPGAPHAEVHPWRAFGALVVGFFMILIDSTIVIVAMPRLMSELGADLSEAVWVTSGYLLASAVPLLITGRLGDRIGPRRAYLIGLAIFTLASLWCGLADSIGMLIVARVVQGLGAALLSPQTMTVITRVFPPERRGAAMGAWGSVAGVATLVGPIAGGLLTDGLGWSWIFFVNVPIGVVAFVLALRLLPHLETHAHRFDWLGVVLSGLAMFCIVFGVQEGESHDWGSMPIAIGEGTFDLPLVPLILVGVVLLVLFVLWQRRAQEPLVPLELFRDRNFSGANLAVFVVGAITATISIPLMLYFQAVLGFTPTEAALMLIPMAVVGAVVAPITGRLVQMGDARPVAVVGLLSFGIAAAWFAGWLTPGRPVWELLLPGALLGVANGCSWGPISITATRNLSPRQAGAGSGVYNTTRQLGAVLGAAAITSVMTWRFAENLGGQASSGEMPAGGLPEFVQGPFAASLGESLLLLTALAALGVLAVLTWERPKGAVRGGSPATADDAAPAAASRSA